MSNESISSDRSMSRTWSSGGGKPTARKDDIDPGSSHLGGKGGVGGEVHRKMMAQILNYIASMHQSLGSSSGADDSNNSKRGGNNGPSFVRRPNGQNLQANLQSFFFQEQRYIAADGDERLGVLFSTQDFRHLQAIEAESSKALFPSPTFNFYAASTNQALAAANRKRSWFGSSPTSDGNSDGKSCWFRLTRLTASDIPEPPTMSNAAVRRYLENWRDNDPELRDKTVRDMLTLETMTRTPEIAEKGRAKEIKAFIKNYRRYLRKKAYQQVLEPMYNQLFEWVQQTHHNDELVWGLGHARMNKTSDKPDENNRVVNGPLLEILMEVELSRDGALLVRPREHTGVAVNREVSELLASNGQRLADLHQAVAELDPTQIAPGEPKTYIPFFKKCVVELSSGGSFQLSSNAPKAPAPDTMIITEAWCLYARSKPGSVWARDAIKFRDQLKLPPIANGGGLELPRATLALTHGPSAFDVHGGNLKKDAEDSGSIGSGLFSRLLSGAIFQSAPAKAPMEEDTEDESEDDPIVFPLPASEAQNRIADLLLRKNYPAIVAEGPPGTGKTHTIANMICANLSHGKRVLVTSKGAAALSVIRERLPPCVQDLCVDISLSESKGMRQLQQTVERLANRVSKVSTDMVDKKCRLLKRNIKALEKERLEVDSRLAAASDDKRRLIQQPNGQKLVASSLELIEKAPWLMNASWPVERLTTFRDELAVLAAQQNKDMNRVALGFTGPLPEGLVSEVSVKAGVPLAAVKLASKKMLSNMPLFGAAFGSGQDSAVDQQLAAITIDGRIPVSMDDWKRVLHVLRFEESIQKFHQSQVEPLLQQEGWPENELYELVGQGRQQRIIRAALLESVDQALQLKKLALTLNVAEEVECACECYTLDTRRSQIASQIQSLAEELVDASVISQLSKSLTAEAHSALIRFSQIAGRAKFSRASQPSNMSARQRRKRQEYLESFDQCVRYIPCWIMTSAQISDYLPAEVLFDLAIIDESSQSDITVLPGMLRGKQWLIVGDSKQVSPTESFISEDSIDNLRAALPSCPLQDSLMPGQSFFDFAAQAYPRGRVVLNEHFRCAPEIIEFSNHQFYHGRLVPLRLPSPSERLSPSLIDVRVPGGVKTGKTNEKEIEEIVSMVHDYVNDGATTCALKAKTIGIISLGGDEQSKTIRGRLMNSIGTAKMHEHDILVGDPPTFQGNEKDIIFLSMVCSPKQVPAQNRLMYFQRMNVALSRARDRMVLVRSVDAKDITNDEDARLPVLKFFEEASKLGEKGAQGTSADTGHRLDTTTFGFRARAEALLENLLRKRGFSVRRMGVVWNHALCVEHRGSSARAGLCVENAGETKEEWDSVVRQQKSIERVGWKCLRVDGLSILLDHQSAFENIVDFLATAGVEAPPLIYDSLEDEGEDSDNGDINNERIGARGQAGQPEANPMGISEIVAISSDEEEDNRKIAAYYPDIIASREAVTNDQMDAAQFGQVVQLDFLSGGARDDSSMDDSSVEETTSTGSPVRKTARKAAPTRRKVACSSSARSDEAYMSEQSDDGDGEAGKVARKPAPAKRKAARSSSNHSNEAHMSEHSVDVDGEVGNKRGFHGTANECTGTGTGSGDEGSTASKRRRKASYKKLDKYSRDGRWYPDRAAMKVGEEKNQEDEWCDTDSDLPDSRATAAYADADADEDYEPKVGA